MEFFFTRTTPISSIGLLFGALLLAVSTNRGNGTLALVLMTSSSVLPLCPGDCLHLTCNSSSSPVVWTVYDTNNDMNYTSHAGASPSAGIATALPLQVGSFTFNITSQIVDNTESSSHSLISNITVDNVNVALNATVIICTEFATGIQDMVTIRIFNINDLQLDESLIQSFLVNNSMFGISNVTTALDFGKSIPLLNSAVLPPVSYNFNATSDPFDVVEVELLGKESFNISFPYNTRVNVGVEAFACGQSTAATTPIQFNITLSLNLTVTSCRSVESLDHRHSTTLLCHSERHLYQQDVCVITCASGSHWKPNISETDFEACNKGSDCTTKEPNCTCEKFSGTAMNATCTTLTVTVVSSVVTFVLSSLFCSVCCGVLNGYICYRISNRSKAASNQDTSPMYDDIASTTSVHNTKLEMEENKAYATIAAR